MHTQTAKEEYYKTLTHGIGLVLSLVGFFLLIYFDTGKSPESIIAVLLYGTSLTVLYFASTLYHYVKKESRKQKLRILDHISIYLLIAGTYSPLVLITLPESKGWLLFWLVWGMAGAGTILKLFFTGKYEKLSLILYVLMGWLIVLDLPVLLEKIDITGLFLLFLGGFFYTTGILFYVRHRLPYHHVIWHLFVLLGSLSHFLFIFLKVI